MGKSTVPPQSCTGLLHHTAKSTFPNHGWQCRVDRVSLMQPILLGFKKIFHGYPSQCCCGIQRSRCAMPEGSANKQPAHCSVFEKRSGKYCHAATLMRAKRKSTFIRAVRHALEGRNVARCENFAQPCQPLYIRHPKPCLTKKKKKNCSSLSVCATGENTGQVFFP